MGRQAGPAHRDQVLALTLAVLLLTGGVLLLLSCWIGPLATFAAVAVLVVIGYAAPGLARCLAVRRAVRQLLPPCPVPECRTRLLEGIRATGSVHPYGTTTPTTAGQPGRTGAPRGSAPD